MNAFHTLGTRLKGIFYIYIILTLRICSNILLSASFPLYYYVPSNRLFPLTWVIIEFLIAWDLFHMTFLNQVILRNPNASKINHLGVKLNPVLLAIFRPRKSPTKSLHLILRSLFCPFFWFPEERYCVHHLFVEEHSLLFFWENLNSEEILI